MNNTLNKPRIRGFLGQEGAQDASMESQPIPSPYQHIFSILVLGTLKTKILTNCDFSCFAWILELHAITLSVDTVSSKAFTQGEIAAMIVVLQLPPRESCKSSVGRVVM
eukprot:1159439-Pelagomonas_calceolata.AAC.6